MRIAGTRRLGESSLEEEIAHLRGLDLKGLRSRWRGQFKNAAPDYLPRHLLFAVLAYRLQADRSGDLSPDIRKLLDRSAAPEMKAGSSSLVKLDQQRRELAVGTVLTREWKGKAQRVIVKANGFGWNGEVYDSLTKVAFAITGTRWNGPRFFGLRDAVPGNAARTDGRAP